MKQIRKQWLVVFLPLAVFAATLSVTASAHEGEAQNDSWVRVDPQLKGPSTGWTTRTHNNAIGDDYAWTYGYGDEKTRDNWAVWDMGHKHGRQHVYTYIPRLPANHSEDIQATVTYRIYRNGSLMTTRTIDQGVSRGWVSLGTWSFRGAHVRIEAWDNETSEDYRTDGETAASRFAVDAASMRCVSECASTIYDPENIGDLMYDHAVLQNRLSDTEARFARFRRCVEDMARDLDDDLHRLAFALRVENLISSVTGPIKVIGVLVDALQTTLSPIADALESSPTTKRLQEC